MGATPAGAAVALPFLDAMLPHALAAPSTFKPWEKSNLAHPRMICCYVPNGVNMEHWRPAAPGALPEALPQVLSPLNDLRSEINVRAISSSRSIVCRKPSSSFARRVDGT